jgi:hypothetical protein
MYFNLYNTSKPYNSDRLERAFVWGEVTLSVILMEIFGAGSCQAVEKSPLVVILNPSLCHSERAKRLKNLSFRVNSVKDLKYWERPESSGAYPE